MIADKKLAKTITEKLGIQCKTGDKANELFRCIRFQMQSLLTGLDDLELGVDARARMKKASWRA